jgi:hypothetical protein
MNRFNSGILMRDYNNIAIDEATAMICEDNNTPNISPISTVSDVPIIKFVAPAKARAMVFKSSQTLRYGENATLDGSATGKGYMKAAASTITRVPIGPAGVLYMRADSTAGGVDFYFELLT